MSFNDRPRQLARRVLRSWALRAGWVNVAVLCLIAPAAPAQRGRQPKGWRTYPTRYYVIHTDLGTDAVREAALRLTAMAEEYHRRTKGFGGTIRRKLPFHLYSRAADYRAAGGPRGSSGVFKGNRLMAVAGVRPGSMAWHTIQHEGFHQFARYAIRTNLPAWVNEGLAEYFGEGLFTGDGFVVGVVPPRRLRRLRDRIGGGKGKSLRDMMRMTYDDWNDQMDLANYDQAWSMIHFLVHAEDGKYVKRLTRFINDTRRMRYENAWVRSFGRDVKAFEEKWRAHWLSLPDNPTADRYARAALATLTSFWARAAAQGQTFDAAQAFLDAASAGEIKTGRKDWLPPSLLQRAAARAPRFGRWSIDRPDRGPPALTLITPDGHRFTGTYVVKAGKVRSVRVTLVRPAPDTQPG
ncbi:MAG: DUF1570 domain-containing protein [Planctomycetota bacterium]